MNKYFKRFLMLAILFTLSAGICFAADTNKDAIDNFFEILISKGSRAAIGV